MTDRPSGRSLFVRCHMQAVKRYDVPNATNYDASQKLHLTHLDRRVFLSIFITTPFLVGCASNAVTGCDAIIDKLDKSICQQKEIKRTSAEYITVGMIVGAALGAGIAVALQGNPIVGALGGALVGGGVVAAERYLAYRREQAHYDEIQALWDVRRDIRRDTQLALSALESVSATADEIKRVFADTGMNVATAGTKVEKAREVVNQCRINERTFRTTSGIYRDTIAMTPLKNDKDAASDIYKLDNQTSKIEIQARELAKSLAISG